MLERCAISWTDKVAGTPLSVFRSGLGIVHTSVRRSAAFEVARTETMRSSHRLPQHLRFPSRIESEEKLKS